MTQQVSLPIDAVLPAIEASLRAKPNLVIEAPPGAGKTTRVPRSMLRVVSGEVVVLEPRRIAARMAARRVASELGEDVGATVGYQVRFEEKIGPRTRLRFVTEGILTRRLLSDPELRGVDAVVLDEFHERHLESDLALALLKRLQRVRPELLIVVMSATLDAGPVARYLGDCPAIRSEGRMFPLSVRYMPYSDAPLPVQVRSAVQMLGSEGHSGNLLTFLPGAAEIRRASRECESVARATGLVVLPLHGDLSPAEQDRAVLPSRERKLILATNVAESSVTVEGVSAVIDSGLARQASHSPWTGLPQLQVGRVSKASCVQRGGRAGRTGPGQVVRLYPEEDFLLRPDQETPEIQRADLSQLLLALRALGIVDVGELEWLDAPPAEAIRSAEFLLDRVGAEGGMAQRLARFPLHPRLSRIVVEAVERGVGHGGCRVAALLSSGARTESNDLLAALERPPDPQLRQQINQLMRLARVTGPESHREDELLLAVLAGFPDRVARRRSGTQLQLSTGVSAELAGQQPGTEFMVALDAEDRKENALPLVRLMARVEPEWLLEMFPAYIRETARVEWNHASERVEWIRSLLYDELVLEETRAKAPDVEAADLLTRKVLEQGIESFVDGEALQQLEARFGFAGVAVPDLGGVVRRIADGLHSFAEFRGAAKNLIPLMEQEADPRRVAELAPGSVRLPSGRQTPVHYEHGRPPWIESRLQDFFGMQEGPRIGPERTPVLIHLLAPNRRAVQVTTDLAGFWKRLYPQVRRELMRRYPRHAWPEDPTRP